MRIAPCLLAAAVLALPTAAYADDTDWSGIYAGVEAGGSSGRLQTSGSDSVVQLSNVFVAGRGIVIVPGTTVSSTASERQWNFVYGGVLGGQWQSGGLIFGLEGDVHGAREFASNATTAAIPTTILAPASSAIVSRSARMSYDWSLRARLGTALGDKAMIYASGGLAGTRVRLTGQDSFTTPAGAAATGGGIPAFVSPAIGPVVLTASERRNLTGWTAGAGGEVKISSNIGFGIDGRYTNYGSHDFALASGCAGNTAIAGTCAGTSRTAPAIVINGTTLNPAADVTPAVIPGTTRANFSDFRVTARVVLHF